MKYWEIIADNLSKAGWSLGCVSAIDSNGRTIWIADAEAMNLKLDMDNPADREKLRRAILGLVTGSKMRKQIPDSIASWQDELR